MLWGEVMVAVAKQLRQTANHTDTRTVCAEPSCRLPAPLSFSSKLLNVVLEFRKTSALCVVASDEGSSCFPEESSIP